MGIGRVQNDMQALWKPSVSSLYFLYKPNQKHGYIWKECTWKSWANKKHFNAEMRLPYPSWFDHLSFLPFKLFISSWSFWSNSTHSDADESSRVENSKACRHIKYGNWIQSKRGIKYKCWKSKAGYFIHCMTGRKVKFTWNDQNTNRFLENLKI